MSRGKMPIQSAGAGGGSPAASAQNANARRGTKTLAWYISDKILDKNELERDSSSPVPGTGIRPAHHQLTNRKSSVDSESSLNSKNTSNDAFEDEKRRQKRDKRAQRSRRAKEDFVEKEEEEHVENQPGKGGGTFAPPKERKEDYWYYDAKSDGFYYELNGSRGWRKRNPKLHGPGGVPVAKAVPDQNADPQKGSAVAPQQTSKFFPTATAANVPNIKYYDAASDGFFYEMASVDGWRRRQPIGVSPPNSLSSNPSLQQGHLPQGRIFRPMQPPIGRHVLDPQLRQQPHLLRHNLTNAELEDIIVQTTSGGDSSAFSAPLSIGQAHRQHQQAMALGESPASNATPTSAMFGSSFQAAPAQNGVKYHLPQHQQHSSSSTTISSSSLSDDHCSPPPLQAGVPNYAAALLGGREHSAGAGSQLGMWHNRPGMDIAAMRSQQQKQIPAIGSFDEPYEFYWSDNEKTNSERSEPQAPPNPHPSLAAYFSDMSIQQEYNKGLQQQLKQHSERLLGKADPNSLQMKRPSSLRLSCSPHRAAAAKQASSKDYAPHMFNVDKFIAETIPSDDHEKVLRNLSALKTPMVERPGGFDPMGLQDSPLFTPILLKEDGYVWNNNNTASRLHSYAGPKAVDKAAAAAQLGNSAALGQMSGFNEKNNIDKIWGQCPAF